MWRDSNPCQLSATSKFILGPQLGKEKFLTCCRRFSDPERPHSFDAGQVDGGELVDPDPVPDDPQRTLLEAAGAGDQLALTLDWKRRQLWQKPRRQNAGSPFAQIFQIVAVRTKKA